MLSLHRNPTPQLCFMHGSVVCSCLDALRGLALCDSDHNNSFCLADIRHPEELSLLRKPRDPKKKKKKLEEFEEEALELEGPLLTPGSGTSADALCFLLTSQLPGFPRR